jgi:hypothetical protein
MELLYPTLICGSDFKTLLKRMLSSLVYSRSFVQTGAKRQRAVDLVYRLYSCTTDAFGYQSLVYSQAAVLKSSPA